VDEYGYNLANFIRDVREDLNAPTLPVIVGELGQHGTHPEGDEAPRVLSMRAAEKSVTLMDEFRDNTLYVPTAPHVVSPEDHKVFNGNYHYYGRADTFYQIGHAFGRGMLELLDSNRKRGGAKRRLRSSVAR
jgi:Carbohydrate esterase, sialic acid-specific acetylesterase